VLLLLALMLVLHCTHTCIYHIMQVDLAGNLEQSDEAGKRELAFMANLLEERNYFLQKEAAGSHPEPMASSLYSGDNETLICEFKIRRLFSCDDVGWCPNECLSSPCVLWERLLFLLSLTACPERGRSR
jgi:hypothetical protein